MHFASNFDCCWDFTLYSEGMMVLNPRSETNPTGPNVKYVSINRLINEKILTNSLLEYIGRKGMSYYLQLTNIIKVQPLFDELC